MKELQQEELKEVQMRILDYVDSFCRKNDIKYTLSGGTLLGAIRHGGFIPWDDDIDIQMLRSEYNKFTELWKKSHDNPNYELINIESGNNKGYPFGKIQDNRTVSYVGNLQRLGVFIDVFPLDNVEDENDFSKRHNVVKRLFKIRGFVFSLMRRSQVHLFDGLYARLSAKINDVANKKNGKDCPYVFEMTSGLLCKKPMPKSIFKIYKDVKFEDRTYMSVEDYDTYLTNTFGDYMKLPPVEKRVSHHSNSYFWKVDK